jgi:HK97 family phage portal protein
VDLFNTKKLKALSNTVSSLQQVISQNVTVTASRNFVNQNIAHYAPWSLTQQVNRYATTDDIYSIVRLIAQTSALVPLYSYQVTNDKAFKKLSQKGFDLRSMLQTKMLQTKAFEDLPETDRLYQLLEDPHLYMSKFEFFEALHSLLLMQGECILYKIRKFQFDEDGNSANAGEPLKLEFLESHNVVRYVSGFPHTITRYEYQENGVTIMKDIPPEDIIHVRYFKGLSPLQALHRRLQRMDSEMDTSVAQLQNGGVPGIVYDENDDGTVEVELFDGGKTSLADSRKVNFYKYLQNKGNKGAPFMAAGKLGYIELGLKLADMEVAELSNIDFKKLCNAFQVSDRLFNNDATGSEVSDDNAQKSLYTRACLPAVFRVRDSFIAGLVSEFEKGDKKKRTIREDISEIPALQGDMLKMAQAIASLPFFIPNQVQELFHQEKFDDPLADKMYVKTGYVALEDLQGSGELPITEDYN